jgi:hypothetical protein
MRGQLRAQEREIRMLQRAGVSRRPPNFCFEATRDSAHCKSSV